MNSPIKYHGGKAYLANRLVAMMPPHLHYVEPFAGSLAVLLAKDPEGTSEVVNDLSGALTNFWRVLADPAWFPAFQRLVQATPFSEPHWQAAHVNASGDGTPVVEALLFFIRCRQSLAGRMKSFAPISRNRIRRGMNEQASAWLSAIDGLPEVHERLKRVVILNRDAIDVIKQQDAPGTLFYLDPPYVATERTAPDVYAHEMTIEQHKQLLTRIIHCAGKVMISGYANALYDDMLHAWHRTVFDLPNHAAGGDTKRRMEEVVWTNFKPE